MEKLTSNFKKLSLHDSHIEKVDRCGSELIFEFDWAKLSDYLEKGIDDFIVMGKTFLRLSNIKKETFRAYDESEGKFNDLEIPDDVEKSWQEISNTEIDEERKVFMIDGMFNDGKNYWWVEWEIHYGDFELEWNSYVTGEDWKKGKLPRD